MKNCRVSIIIPTYNHAQYIGGAIRSVLGQTFEDYEIIVVDDGSQDNTQAIVARFDARVRYIWQENQGVSAARNTGIAAAKGELIGLLDADDLYEPNFLSTLVSMLDTNPEADGVYCSCQTVDETNQPLPQRMGKVVAPDQLYPLLLQGGIFPPLCMFVYKYCYEQAGLFDRTFQGSADWDMWLRIAKRFTLLGTPQILARYRLVAQSMSSDPTHMLQDQLGVLQKHLGPATATMSLPADVRQAYARLYIRTATEYLQWQNVEAAYRLIGKAITIEPPLLLGLDFFYEIGYGKQPRGFRGDYQTIDIEHSASLLKALLDRLFRNDQIAAQVKAYRCAAYANAYFVLGMLSYGARHFPFARYFFLRAVVISPAYLFHSLLVYTWLKSLLPVHVVNVVRDGRLWVAHHLM